MVLNNDNRFLGGCFDKKRVGVEKRRGSDKDRED